MPIDGIIFIISTRKCNNTFDSPARIRTEIYLLNNSILNINFEIYSGQMLVDLQSKIIDFTNWNQIEP